jgi:SAM-dependent methyltransferase
MSSPIAPPPGLPQVFDRQLIARHFARRPADSDDFVTRLALEDLATRLITVTRTFEAALIMAPDARDLPVMGRSANGTFSFARVATVVASEGAPLVDPEMLVLERDDHDLIVSLFDLTIVNDVPGFLARIRRHLRPDGLFIAVAIGGQSLNELREAWLTAEAELLGGASARVAPFIPLADAGGLLQRTGFTLPVTDVETHTVRYGHPLKLMAELKALGAQNPLAERPSRPVSRRLLQLVSEAYGAIAMDDDARVRATLELIWVSGWAPHENQQKPARRGSATVSLKDVLEKKP